MSHIIFWRSNNVRCTFQQLHQAAAQHNLPEPPAPPDADEALRAAVRAATRKLSPGEHIEPLHQAHKRAGLSWACGTWDKATAHATFQHLHTWPTDQPATPWARDMAALLDGLTHEASTYADATTVAKYLPRVVRDVLHGVPMRDGGGVYFVPAGQRVDDVRALNQHIPGLTVCTVAVSAADAQTAMAPVVGDALQDEARALLDEFNRLKDPDVLTRPSTWGKRIAELDDLRQKVELFAATVGNDLQEVRDTLDALGSLADEHVAGGEL